MLRNSLQNRIAANFFMLLGVPVLMYHHVGALPANADKMRKDLTVSVADFEKQLDYLQQNGYETITTQELADAAENKLVLPQKPIVMIFDDGYKDVFENAVPRLSQRGMQGVFAVVTNYQGFPDYADWPTIQAALAHGMEIIPHTRHHVDLKNSKYSHQARVDEILGSIADIKQYLGQDAAAFVYPYGNYNDDVINILKSSNVKIAFTTKFGLFQAKGSLLAEPRVRVHGAESIETFARTLSGTMAIVKEQYGPRVPDYLQLQQAAELKSQ